ncbi:PAS-domain containing protein [Tropicibacter oceani]|uniref:PAS-domain containing protein n=1 Tax=Tropicibacter oceani TaxID=3058420 RepID=A0ABY8QIS3_9RHOB|nr:PAS-domain containing protein [Tropicibacter oceani]WGW04556.1 PAS-domain containing protein [Tropicibacter oceani]
MQDHWAIGIGILSGVALLILGWLVIRITRSSSPRSVETAGLSETVFLFDRSGALLDCTADAHAILGASVANGGVWRDLHEALVTRFPDLPVDLPTQPVSLISHDIAQTELTVTPDGSRIRATLKAAPLGPAAQHQYLVRGDQLEQLSTAFDVAPNPIWTTDHDDQVIWKNAAFDVLLAAIGNQDSDKPLFDMGQAGLSDANSSRVRVEMSNGTTRWFEVTSRKTPEGSVHFATDIDALIEAELAQRNFVQTLAKTFAHLPIGLAVFDRDRRLVLFNPALVDLTRLPVNFLSARPNLLSFFDHMRETRMMPEPKNYATWREQLTDVITAARDDRYCETWSLASGLTYKISGRPHPDGAVAFLLEDISAEISLTRRFRSELELTQSVIDCFHDAVAVFSRLGVLTFSNSAYRKLWSCDPDSAFSELTIVDATNEWKDACDPSPIWSELREYVLTMQDRAAWSANLTLRDGDELQCWIEPVSAGATMVRFSNLPASRARLAPPSSKVATG